MCNAYMEKAGEMLKENLKGTEFLCLLSPLGRAGVAAGELCMPAMRPCRRHPGHPDPCHCAVGGDWCGQKFCSPSLNANFYRKKNHFEVVWIFFFVPSERILEFVTVNLGYVQYRSV